MAEEPIDKREAVLRATLELIAEQGFHATPMSQIAERARIGVGTIYRYFPGKDDLINALYLETKQRIARTILVGFDESAGVGNGLRYILTATIRYLVEHPLDLMFSEQYEHSPLIRTATKHEGIESAGPLLRLLQRGVEAQVVKPLPFTLLGALISGPIVAVAKLYAQGELVMSAESLAQAVEAIIDSIRR